MSRAAPDSPPPNPAELRAVASGSHPHPHAILGRHPARDGFVIRVLRPLADSVTAALADGRAVTLVHLQDGIWAGSHAAPAADYTVTASYGSGERWTTEDAYRFAPGIDDVDLYLFSEGRHEELWRMLGAHPVSLPGVTGETGGTLFTLWAPHARAVRVIGDFNSWDGVQHAMRRLDANGVWELFIPGIGPGSIYKYELLTTSGEWVKRADPMANAAEAPPATASVVTRSQHRWSDSHWLAERAGKNPIEQPVSIYELHVGSWRPGLGYRDLADQLIEYLRELGFTHVEFLPLAEHPYGPSWGYQVTGYYAPTSRFGSPDDLRYLIDRLHQAGIGVIMDWVPGHFPRDEWALARFDGQPLYEHSDPRRGEHQDWGTLVFDYGHSQVRNFLVANALFWLEEFHVDGLRVDAVASMLYLDYSREDGEWEPNRYGGRENLEAISFLQEVNATAYKRNPGIMMIAEESTSYPGVTSPTETPGLGFGFKWNMGWMHDTLDYIQHDPMYRSHHNGELTFSMVYAYSEHFVLPISHDEVVHGKRSLLGKMPGDHWQRLANVRVYLSYLWTHPGKKLLFMGQEFGQPSEWSDHRGLDWWVLDQSAHRGLLELVSRMNRLYVENSPLWARDSEPGGFEWIDQDAARNVVAYLRWDHVGNVIAIVQNFSGNPVGDYRLALPFGGVWEEILNTDATEYAGSGVGNLGAISAEDVAWAGRPASAAVTLPPLGALWLRPRR